MAFFVFCDIPHPIQGREVGTGSQNAATSRPIENPMSSRADIWKTTGKTRIIHNQNSSLRFGYFSNPVSLEYETQEAEQKLCVTYICASITLLDSFRGTFTLTPDHRPVALELEICYQIFYHCVTSITHLTLSSEEISSIVGNRNFWGFLASPLADDELFYLWLCDPRTQDCHNDRVAHNHKGSSSDFSWYASAPCPKVSRRGQFTIIRH